MKGFIETIKNIFKIEELRVRILYTLGFILIYRLGSFIVLPGVDPAALQRYTSQAQEGLLGMINMFAGGAFSRASIFALGIMPYISASIIIQLLGIAVPYFQKLQKEGQSGRNKINQITRVLTIAITAVQAVSYLINLQSQVPESAFIYNFTGFSYFMFMLTNTIILVTGTMFVMWLGEKITDRGIGNGISLIIMIGIIANLPRALLAEFEQRLAQAGGGLVIFLVEIVALLLVILATVLLVQGTRRIPVQYVKRVAGSRQFGGVRQYIPLKVNASGVMPIIFAQALMFLPATFAAFFEDSDMWRGIGAAFTDFTSVPYNIVFGILIILFTFFYTAVTVNSNQIADDLKRNGGFVPGVKPGKATADFIDTIMSRITLPGSFFLALVAIFPAIAASIGVNTQFSHFFGGTSLLIMVAVILDTLQQIESHLLMRHYDGLMKTGRLKGRTSLGASV
ncbi:MAG: preprotein translocase subunit SecY [Bacteroidia bacterium]